MDAPPLSSARHSARSELRQDAIEALLRIAAGGNDTCEQRDDFRTIRDALDAIPTEAPNPSDQELVSAARHAGLCFPDCWYLEEAIDPDTIAINQHWIQTAESPCDRQERQHIVDQAATLARSRLAQLRLFIHHLTSP